jgi:2-alkyl-3-oxoalkanoate reductase
MRIFIAGGSGVIGRALVPLLVADGHTVVALTRGADRAAALAAAGAQPVLGDIYDTDGLARHMRQARPDVVLHQLTAFGAKTHDPAADPLQETIRIRTEGTRSLVAAMQLTGARRLVTQSISFISSPDPAGLDGHGLSVEATPHFLEGGAAIQPLAQAVQTLEQLTLATPGIAGCVLRYGWFYGRGTNYDPDGPIARGLRKGRSPLVRSAAGLGRGVYSHIAVQDAAQATLLAIQQSAEGIFNIVDDQPAPHAEWLGWLARHLQAPPPQEIDEAAARAAFGAMLTHFMATQRGASNAKARRELGWQPRWPDWRTGFSSLFHPGATP